MRIVLLLIAGLILTACTGTETATPTLTPSRQPAATTEATSGVTPAVTLQTPTAITQIPPLPTRALACDTIIRSAVDRVGDICNTLGRNEACYGNTRVEAEFRAGVNAAFNTAGDVVALNSLRSLRTFSLDEAAQQWGVAILKAQADLPDTLPGQNVTFLLYGDAQLDDLSAGMEAVRITTGIGQLTCEEAPQSAVLVQSPEGVDVTMTINGAQITLGSTVHIRAVAHQSLTLATIEGMAIVTAFDKSEVVLPGFEVSMPLGDADGVTVTGAPSNPRPFDASALANAPVTLLERAVVIPPPGQQTATPTAGASAQAQVTQVATRPAATPDGSVLTADTTVVGSGQCTTLRWDAADAQRVFFEGQSAPNSGNRQVCPTRTTTYTLIVAGSSGQTPYRVTVTVQ